MPFCLQNPGNAALDCEECKRFLYNIDTGKPYLRQNRKQERPKGSPTPCHKCPKKSPERWQKIKPSRRTYATLDLYRKCRSTGGLALTPAELADDLLLSNLATLDEIYRLHELASQQQTIGDLITALRISGAK